VELNPGLEGLRGTCKLPDPRPVEIVLGAVCDLLPSDPVWPLLVGPPWSGKTESRLVPPGCHPVSPSVKWLVTLGSPLSFGLVVVIASLSHPKM
jgi:hypothetical protein